MIDLTTIATATIVQIGAALPAGLLAGAAYFLSLHWAVRAIGSGAYAKAAIVQCIRFGLLAAMFYLLARIGAAALLSGALGLLLARQIVLHCVRSMP